MGINQSDHLGQGEFVASRPSTAIEVGLEDEVSPAVDDEATVFVA